MTYLICITPLSVARWLFFFGHNVKYQGTFFATTLFSLSGTFNAILFFFTRPDLVVDSIDSLPPAPPVEIQNQPFRGGEPTTPTPSSWKLGSLTSHIPVVSASVPPHLGMAYNGGFDPYNPMPLDKGANDNIHALPHRMQSDSDSNGNYFPGERSHGDFR